MSCYSVQAYPFVDLMRLRHPLVELSTNVDDHIVARGIPRVGIENRLLSIADVAGEHMHML